MPEFEGLLYYNPVLLALFATLFTWGITALGASIVFFFQGQHKRLLNSMLGFAAGVMLAASFWSLLEPAIDLAGKAGMIPWVPAVTGFLLGAAFVMLLDSMLPLFSKRLKADEITGRQTPLQRSILLIFAITLHNIPEGLAIGVAFGALATNPDPALLAGAIALTLGIGIQNFPEGAAVSLPLRREGFSCRRAFHYGQLSGIVEPMAGVLGAYLVITITSLLPFALSFAAGSMVYVVVRELIPESHRGRHTKYATIGAMLGFAIMMMLDVALG
jgi:zinc transporter, ZIP family